MASDAQPLCRHFGPCGGCDWQDVPYAEQLARKRRVVTDLLHAALGHRAADVLPVLPMPIDETGWPSRFRHKASFVFGQTVGGQLAIGHYAAHSNRVVPIVECPVHSDLANRLAFALHSHLARARIPPAGADLRGVLRHLLIRTSSDNRQAVAMLIVTRNEKALRAPIRAFLQGKERSTGFLLNIHRRVGPYMIGPETLRLHGRSHVREQIDQVSFLVSPTAFFQTNTLAARTLVNLVATEASTAPQLHIADLYSGSGLFALTLAARGHRVIAVEENAQAVRDGEANAQANKLDDSVHFIRSRVEDALARVGRSRIDFAVIDPPRDGCPDGVLRGLFKTIAPAKVMYVSCNPAALARELPTILDAGYRVRRVQPVDMFPHTTHIETVVTLDSSRAAPARRV